MNFYFEIWGLGYKIFKLFFKISTDIESFINKCTNFFDIFICFEHKYPKKYREISQERILLLNIKIYYFVVIDETEVVFVEIDHNTPKSESEYPCYDPHD